MPILFSYSMGRTGQDADHSELKEKRVIPGLWGLLALVCFQWHSAAKGVLMDPKQIQHTVFSITKSKVSSQVS